MIWLGDIIPNYVNFAVNEYQFINYDYNINFITFSFQDIYEIWNNKRCLNINDSILYRSIDILFNTYNYQYYYKYVVNAVNQLYNNRLLMKICDIFKMEILNEYGGIYVDCDTFPIRKFDYDLLKLGNFEVVTYYGNILKEDNFFIGRNTKTMSNENFYINRYIKNTTLHNVFYQNKNKNNTLKYLINRKNFFDCTLEHNSYSFSKNNYLDHYYDNTWKRKNNIINTLYLNNTV